MNAYVSGSRKVCLYSPLCYGNLDAMSSFFCGRDLECIFDKKKTLSMNLNWMNGVYIFCVLNKFINKFLNYQNFIIFSLSGKGRSSLNKMEYFYEPFFKLIVLS